MHTPVGKYQLARLSADGQTEVLYSFANSVDTNFALPAGYAAFPFTNGAPLASSGGTIRTVRHSPTLSCSIVSSSSITDHLNTGLSCVHSSSMCTPPVR